MYFLNKGKLLTMRGKKVKIQADGRFYEGMFQADTRILFF
jgi:hypothetical protein